MTVWCFIWQYDQDATVVFNTNQIRLLTSSMQQTVRAICQKISNHGVANGIRPAAYTGCIGRIRGTWTETIVSCIMKILMQDISQLVPPIKQQSVSFFLNKNLKISIKWQETCLISRLVVKGKYWLAYMWLDAYICATENVYQAGIIYFKLKLEAYCNFHVFS